MNRVCDICSEGVSDVWVIEIKDDRTRFELSGHLKCINEAEGKVKKLDKDKKMKVDQILTKLNLNIE